MPNTVKKIVVTGAAGFIGSNLSKNLLENKYHVIGLDNLTAGTLENIPQGLEFYKKDIIQDDLTCYFRKAHTVIHLAAKNCLDDCAKNPYQTALTNAVGTVSVMQAAIKENIKHIIYADTSAEYEGIFQFPTPTEKVAPLSVYATSKRSGYLMAKSLSDLHGLPLTAVRYFNVYGPAQDWRRVVPPVMSAFTRKLLNNEAPFIFGTGQKSRDFIHVDDINNFHLFLIENERLWGQIYNLGSGKDSKIIEIYKLIANLLGSSIEPIFKEDLPCEAQKTQADISKTLETGWKPKVTLEEGVLRFIEYTKKQLHLI